MIVILAALLHAGGAAAPFTMRVVDRSLIASHRYLLLPVKNGAPKHWVRISSGGREIDDFEIEIGDGAPDWWSFLDLSAWQGKQIDIEAENLAGESKWMHALTQADDLPGAEPLYRESRRPQFHFTARRGWINDPNGLVFYKGEYHLFFQHNPYGVGWGNMHWGHAVSPDLIHWRELPEALYPDALGTMFSGSAVVDAAKTAALPGGREAPIVLIYTAAGSTSRASRGKPSVQCLASSADGGATWTKFSGNPVLGSIADGNRDPKVVWFAPAKQWVMALYLDADHFAIFRSPDLKQWTKTDDVAIPGDAECPNFFEIPVQGHRGESKWVIFGASGMYRVGSFDGAKFRPETDPVPLNHGDSYYAAQVYTNLPRRRRVLIPWARQEFPAMPFSQKMGVPVELTLRQTDEGLRLCVNPVREISSLVADVSRIGSQSLDFRKARVLSDRGELLDLDLALRPGRSSKTVWTIRGVVVSYDASRHRLTCEDASATLLPQEGKVRIRALVDRTSIELFGNQGEVYMPMAAEPIAGDERVEITAANGSDAIASCVVRRLRPAWPEN